MSDDRLYLSHMLESIRRIREFTAAGREEFMASLLIQDAVIRNFEVVGEAAKRLSEDCARANPEIPWRRIAGFRDVLIHQYMGVDLLEVWNIVVRDLPTLETSLQKIADRQ